MDPDNKDRLNICLLNDSFPPTIDGVANAVLNYAKIIEDELGHSVVVTPSVPDADDSIYSFPVVRYPSIDTRKMIGYVTGYPFSPEAAHMIEAEKISLLHVHCPVTSCLLARQLAESNDLPIVLTWHTKYDIDIANAVKSKILQEGALNALIANVNACDEIWTVSKGAGENLRSLGYEGDYLVMPNGVDFEHLPVTDEHIRKVTEGYDLPKDIPCYIFVGRLMWYKGLRIILDALKIMKSEGKTFRMVFVGGGGEENEVREYVRESGLDKEVIFTGPVYKRDELRGWYGRSDLFLFPSTFDTNGLVVREAAACDTASVIIKGSCAAEGVTDGRNGFLIEENAESLAAKLIELSDDPGYVRQAGKTAGSEIYISWEESVRQAYDRYGAVIDNYKRGVYGKRDPLRGSWMQSQGELMQIIGSVEAAGRSFLNELDAIQKEADMNFRSLRNKVMTEIITHAYEAQKELEEKKDDILELWYKLDRYL